MTLNSENYGGREQTFAKHFFLDRYLERVAYNLFASQSFDVFTYVDGFSGPWQSANEKREDTSFVIALNKLRGVRNGLSRQGRRIKIRCLFIEKDRQAFQELEKVIGEYPRDIEIQVICGEFENQIATITNFIDKTFSFVFIDPTGWTGFGLDIIRPLLQLRGEILINFMFDEINRFLDDSRSEIRTSYDRLFGGGGWRDEIREGEKIYGMRREDAVLHVYQERLRKAGNFEHVTSTRILK
ncbi:MAG: three-Cys-motif partner protein TcmP, partial [Rhodospirillales bacterium]|nr:three-Cys-motif partner protein TcmP [Rhodospirillales bacterium]